MLIFNCFKPPKVLNIKVLIKDTGGGQRKKGRGLKEENEQKEKRSRDRMAFPIENSGKPTSAYLEAPIPIKIVWEFGNL